MPDLSRSRALHQLSRFVAIGSTAWAALSFAPHARAAGQEPPSERQAERHLASHQKKAQARGRALAERACRSNSARSCELLGYAYEEGIGGPRDALSAVEAYENACAADRASACDALSSLFARADTGVTDREQSARFARLAKELHVRDCEHDVAKACWSLAHEELDTARQLALFEKACALDDSDSCLEAGRIYDPSVYADNGEFEAIPRSKARANPLYKKARRLFTAECAAGAGNACYWLGLMSLSGWDAEVSGTRAIAFFVRACDLGDLSGCSQVAGIYKFGWGGIAVNVRKAAEWHERACNKGKIQECNSAAFLYEEGERIPANPRRAMRLYQRACEQGDTDSCERAGRLRARLRR